MDLTRRDFLGLCGGGAAFAVLAGLGLRPRTAYAVAGIDDAALGGLVLLIATLGGYAVSRSVANGTLAAMGYGFSDFVSDASRQSAAVTQAIADANNLGVELNRSNAEQAAAAIAAGTGYFGEVMGDAASSGRVALDGFISGAGELPAVLRTLVGQYLSSVVGVDGNVRVLPEYTTWVSGGYVIFPNTIVMSSSAIRSFVVSRNVSDVDIAETNSYVLRIDRQIYDGSGNTAGLNVGQLFCFEGLTSLTFSKTGDTTYRFVIEVTGGISYTRIFGSKGSTTIDVQSGGTFTSFSGSISENYNLLVSSDLVSGTLPAVDRAVDAPDVIGPGYDSLPLGNDLVIDPSTNDVVSAGSLPLPTGIPDVFGDFVGTLEDLLAGVVPGVIGLPVSVTEPVVVGTAEGVTSMPISDAIATETTLAGTLEPPAPTPPPGTVDPPVTVPEGPWTPAVALPFAQLWPFNMIYSFVQLFEDLGA